jgi:spore photoproduct lyase
MYAYLKKLLLGVHKDLCVYLCMESEDVWREVFGFTPAERGGLSGMLDRRALV